MPNYRPRLRGVIAWDDVFYKVEERVGHDPHDAVFIGDTHRDGAWVVLYGWVREEIAVEIRPHVMHGRANAIMPFRQQGTDEVLLVASRCPWSGHVCLGRCDDIPKEYHYAIG